MDIAMIPNLDVDQLKTFLAIADSGSFTKAAEAVNKTQSAVSMQMKRLEESLGRALFARDGRGSRFTLDGERFIDPRDLAETLVHAAQRSRAGRVIDLAIHPPR